MTTLPKALWLAPLLISGAGGARATEMDLRVIGSIVPATCSVSLQGGGQIDFGRIAGADLADNPDDITALPVRSISYVIECGMPMVVTTSWEDARPGAEDKVARFSLGKQGGVTVGRYRLFHSSRVPPVADGRPVTLIESDDRGISWRVAVNGTQLSDGGRLHAYAALGTLVPGVHKIITGAFQVRGEISPKNELDMEESIRLDGLSTMTLRY